MPVWVTIQIVTHTGIRSVFRSLYGAICALGFVVSDVPNIEPLHDCDDRGTLCAFVGFCIPSLSDTASMAN